MIAVYQNMQVAEEAYFASEKANQEESYANGLITAQQLAAAEANIDNEILKSQEATALKKQQVEDTAAKEVQQAWQKVTNPIENSFTQALDGMLKGTETFRQAVTKSFDSLALDIINSVVKKMLQEWLTAEAQKIAASQSGAAILRALDLENLVSAKASGSTGSIASITDAAAVAAANAFASTAAIPYVGPFLAPAAAAEAEAEVMAFSAQVSARGGYEVPRDMQMMVHEDEMILPNHISQGIREKILNNPDPHAGDDTANTFHVSTMDSKSFEKFLGSQRNRNAVANMVSKASKRGNSNVRGLR